jgi:hypothetical protein
MHSTITRSTTKDVHAGTRTDHVVGYLYSGREHTIIGVLNGTVVDVTSITGGRNRRSKDPHAIAAAESLLAELSA